MSKLKCIREYFSSGKLMYEYYEDELSRRTGLLRHWHENGQLMLEVNYLNNLVEGVSKTYTENGVLIIYQEFISGKLNGVYKSWFDDGTRKEDGLYVNDIRQLGYKWYKHNGDLWHILDETDVEKFNLK